ncbi:MAG: NAD(P)H-hydrate dehydratase [Frankiaceae bacterium]|nr:NAD(P)H-hydrate dehydratase [Frankiaceae bacterium]
MAEPEVVHAHALQSGWPLRAPQGTSDKEERGAVLVVGGARGMPGAVLLGGIASLRVGAGKLTVATSDAHSAALGTSMPEAGVIGLPTTASGAISPTGVDHVVDLASKVDAMLLGPGLADPDATKDFVSGVLRGLDDSILVVLDAMAVTCGALEDAVGDLGRRFVITPNLTEAGYLLDDTDGDDHELAMQLARRYGVIAVLNSAVATPDGETWLVAKGNPGLGTSGSGDVLAGTAVGVAARTGDPIAAALWGLTLHRAAGDRLAARTGPVGFLARELLDELPGCLRDLTG